MNNSALTPAYARYLIRLTRPFPNFDFNFIKPLRKKAVDLLGLHPGERVLDVGCGMGGSFHYLVQAVGQSGKVTGIEISPEVVINARKRIEKNHWDNVQVITSSAQKVKLDGLFDGLVMFAAPDVYDSEEALENIMPHLRENAGVVVFGAKNSDKKFGGFLNRSLKMILTRLSFNSTPKPTAKPWALLEKYVDNLTVEEYFFGSMFLVSGKIVKK